MASAEGSFIGIAKQAQRGTPITTDNAFKYLLFNQGSVAPQNQVVPLDPEVGGGAMLRDLKKMGVVSGGALQFVPRPETLGMFLLGATGHVTSTPATAPDTSVAHVFTLGTDQFAAPYFTLRSAPGNLWGEQFQDMRVSQLGLEWRGANFVRGSVAFQGGLPTRVATATWNALAGVDGGPQFITPISTIELPTGTSAKCLAGSFMAGMAIPLDEQWVVGSYSPDAMDITQRTFALQMTLKIEDADLYSQMTYDPAGGNNWAAEVMREANFKIELLSDVAAYTGKPYSLTIAGNGESGAAANVAWTAEPIGLRAGRQVIMNVTGIFLADASPITLTLVNQEASY